MPKAIGHACWVSLLAGAVCAPLSTELAAQEVRRTAASATVTASVTIMPAIDAALSDDALQIDMTSDRAFDPRRVTSRRVLVASIPRGADTGGGNRTMPLDPPVARSAVRVSGSQIRYEVAVLY